MKTIIASPKAPKAVGPYSQAVKCGDTLYISGQLPIDGATGAMPESIEDQTRQSLTNLGHILEEAGYSHADIVKTTVLLTDIADFAAMNAVYATFFTKDMPARICYQVSKLPMGAKVEIDAVNTGKATANLLSAPNGSWCSSTAVPYRSKATFLPSFSVRTDAFRGLEPATGLWVRMKPRKRAD